MEIPETPVPQKSESIQMGQNPNHDNRQRILNRLNLSDPISRQIRDRMLGIKPPEPGLLPGPPVPDSFGHLPEEMEPSPGVSGSGVFDEPDARLETIQIEVANVIARLAKSDTLRDVRYAVAMVPTFFPTTRWDKDFLAEILANVHALTTDEVWVSESLCTLARMNPHWESGRAARALTYLALFQTITTPDQTRYLVNDEGLVDTIPKPLRPAGRPRTTAAKEFAFPCPVRGCYKKYNDKTFFDAHMATKHPGVTPELLEVGEVEVVHE